MKNIFQKYKLDIIIVSILVVVSAISSLIYSSLTNNGDALVANIYYQNEIVEIIDLAKEDDIRSFHIQGEHDILTVEVKKNAIRIIESNCPHKDCVNMGWSSSSNKPIICAYNRIHIDIVANNNVLDVEI